MKNTVLLTIACAGCLIAHAQGKTDHSVYVTLSGIAAAESFISGTKQGALTVSFPYTVTNDATGVKSDSVFHSRAIHPFRPSKFFITPVSLEVGDSRFFVAGRFSPMLGGDGQVDNGYRYSLGYGRNFFIGGVHGRKTILIKPSLNIEFINYRGRDNGSPFYLGTIDNADKTIQFDGTSANPTHTYSTGYDNQYTQTDSLKLINIYYGQREWQLEPRITVSNNPYAHLIHWEVYVGYTVPFSQKGKFIFTQDDTHGVAIKPISDDAFTVLYNNLPVKWTPYYVNGLNVGFLMGVSFGGRRGGGR
jgi:hypothetical protein